MKREVYIQIRISEEEKENLRKLILSRYRGMDITSYTRRLWLLDKEFNIIEQYKGKMEL